MVHNIPSQALANQRSVLDRISLPFATFSVTLLLVLVGANKYVVPQFTTIAIDGSEYELTSLRSYHASLLTTIEKATESRNQFVDPLKGTTYGKLREIKATYYSPLQLQIAIDDFASNFASENGTPVHIDSLYLDNEVKTLHLKGDIRYKGAGSLTTLAQFVDLLKDLAFVKNVDITGFQREQDPDIGFYSPFDITLQLQ